MLRESSDTGLRTQQLQLVRQHDATYGLPSGKEDKRRRLKSFSAFFSINFFHIRSSIKRMHSSAFVLMLRSAQNVVQRHELISPSYACRTQEGNVKCPSFTREDSNSINQTRIACFAITINSIRNPPH